MPKYNKVNINNNFNINNLFWFSLTGICGNTALIRTKTKQIPVIQAAFTCSRSFSKYEFQANIFVNTLYF